MADNKIKVKFPNGFEFEGTMEQLREAQALGLTGESVPAPVQKPVKPALSAINPYTKPVPKPFVPHPKTQKPNSKRRVWTPNEDVSIRQEWSDPRNHYAHGEFKGSAYRRIAKALRRTPGAIAQRVCDLGLTKTPVYGTSHKHYTRSAGGKQQVIIVKPTVQPTPPHAPVQRESLLLSKIMDLAVTKNWVNRGELADAVVASMQGSKTSMGNKVTRPSVVATVSYALRRAQDGSLPFKVLSDGLNARPLCVVRAPGAQQPKPTVLKKKKAAVKLKLYTDEQWAMIEALARRQVLDGEITALAKRLNRTPNALHKAVWRVRKAEGLRVDSLPAVAAVSVASVPASKGKRKRAWERWQPSELAELHRLRLSGASVGDISRALKRSRKSVYHRLIKEGIGASAPIGSDKPISAPVPEKVEEKKVEKSDGYMLRTKPAVPLSFDARRIAMANQATGRPAAPVPSAPVVFPVFPSAAVDTKIVESVFRNLTAAEGNMLTYQASSYVLGIESVKQWHDFLLEAIRHSENVCGFFGVPNHLRISNDALVYGRYDNRR